jgi:hypothetical protein
LAKAREGFSVRIIGFPGKLNSFEVIIAEAWVWLKRGAYLELARKVRSPSLASFIPLMPVTSTDGSPTTSPSMSLAISLKVLLI